SVGDISAFSRWRTRPFQTTLPPLLAPDGTVAESIEEKQELLFDSFSATPPGQTDDTTTPPSYPSTLPFPAINPHEVEEACLNVSSTTPGQDGVPVSLLKLAWTLVGKRVHNLFSACLRIGYHPQPFRTARVVVIPKPGKRDRSAPRSYRPISLLSALGKGLERLVARRMASVGLRHRLFGDRQFGALPRRSATDLTSALTHDVEHILADKGEVSMLTLDVQGAFDAVFPGRLRRRLAEQGWPMAVVRWVQSFATDRT